MPNNLTGQNISDTYQRLLQIQGGVLTDGTGSIITVPSASYAVSSSHEIIYELSSSHAELADNATNLTGLTTTVTELNYLDGISSAQGTYVKSMDQDVQQAASPTFRTPKASLLFQHTYADAGPAKPTMTNSEGTVAFYIPSNTSTRLFGWLRENTEMCFIDPSGNFSGQLISPITASGNISSSGNLIVSESLTFGAAASEITFPTALKIGLEGGNDYIRLVDNKIELRAGNLVAVEINDTANKISLGYAGIDEVTIGSSGTTAVKHNFATSNEPLHSQFGQTKMGKSGDLGTSTTATLFITGSGHADYNDIALEIEGNIAITGSILTHITASGNISASGLNHYLGGVVNSSRFRVDGAGYLDSDPTNSSGLFLSNDTRINGPVTASGDISSSGNIKGHAIISKENIAAEWNGIAMLLGTYGKPTTLRGTSTTLNNGNLILSDSTNGHITASGNITASQIKANEYKNQKVVLVQHSFAIARSSINGTYAGDGTEYIQGNTTWGVSDRAWVGNYGDTPDTGFDPTHIQNAYVIPYDVTNLRCDVMLESNKCATNGSESGSFFLFKKAFTGDSYGNSTEALRRIGMNFTLYDHANDGETAYPIFSVSSSGRLSGGNNNPISMSRGDLLFPFYKENVNAGETGHARGTFTITAEII